MHGGDGNDYFQNFGLTGFLFGDDGNDTFDLYEFSQADGGESGDVYNINSTNLATVVNSGAFGTDLIKLSLPTPFVYPPGWYMTVAERIENSRGGVSVDYLIKVIDEPDEVRAARAKAEKDRLAHVSTSYAAMSGLSVPDNHDTHIPNLAGLSLNWATAMPDIVHDLVKHPGPGTLYGGRVHRHPQRRPARPVMPSPGRTAAP